MSVAAVTGSRAIDRAAPWDAHGPSGAPSLIFLHGTRVTRAMWGPQVQSLGTRYRVIAADLPGHGVLAHVPFSIPDASALVAETIDQAAGGRAILVGQSLGGYIAMDCAARHPGMVAGLVLCNCTAEPRTVARTAPRVVGAYLVGAASQRLRGRSVAGDLADGALAPNGSPFPDITDDGVEAAAIPALIDPPATQGWLFKGGGRAVISALRTAFLPRLRKYPGPTLLVNGANDRVFRRGERDFLAACAHGRLEVVDGAGHLVNSEQPERFNEIIDAFATNVYGLARQPSATA